MSGDFIIEAGTPRRTSRLTDWPLPLSALVIWLEIVLWRRDAESAAA
jgi:hypothetical protein